MQALILAAGYGTRLRPFFPNIPKTMVPIHGKPFLWYLLSHLKSNGITEVIIAVSVFSTVIREFFADGKQFDLSISYSETDHPMGTAGAVKNAESLLDETFFVINGDTYLPQDYQHVYQFHKQKKGLGLLVLSKIATIPSGGRVSFQKNSLITGFGQENLGVEKPYVNAGLYVFEKKLLSYIPSGQIVSLEQDIFPQLISKKTLYGFSTIHSFIDIGTLEGYQKAVQYFIIPPDADIFASEI